MKVQRDAFTQNDIYGASATALFLAVLIVAITMAGTALVRRRGQGAR